MSKIGLKCIPHTPKQVKKKAQSWLFASKKYGNPTSDNKEKAFEDLPSPSNHRYFEKKPMTLNFGKQTSRETPFEVKSTENVHPYKPPKFIPLEVRLQSEM
jgi:hypothetical protein